MILRYFLLFGIVLLGTTGWFIVGAQPPAVQIPPAIGEVTRLQEKGKIPTGALFENEEVEHDIFGVPAKDEEMLEAAMEAMGEMPGMDMGGMDMGTDGDAMDMATDGDGMDMGTDGDAMDMATDGDAMDMATDGDGMDMATDGGAMDMATDGDAMDMATDGGAMDMATDGDAMDMGTDGDAMDMATDGDAMDMATDGDAMDMATDGDAMDMATDGGGMDMAGNGEMDEEEEAAMAQQMAGLMISEDGEFDREISLSMSEWTFSDLEIDAKQGERIKFTLRNDGAVLHEFMFMTMVQMQAVSYRAKRADWSLFEHEALFEKSLLLPGQEITFVAEITKPGSWMFMCMLPYHMQMGMMGQMATPGAAMEM